MFWHCHILDTKKYADDCQHALGFFLHHFPYFGMRGEEDSQNLRRAFEETLTLIEREYGESLLDSSISQEEAVPVSRQGAHEFTAASCSDCSGVSFVGDRPLQEHLALVRPTL